MAAMMRQLFILCLIAGTRFALGAVTGRKDEIFTEAMITWLKAEKGFFSSKLEMRRADSNDPSSRFGMYAKGDIQAEEVMIRVPTSIILNGAETNPEGPGGERMECPTIRNLVKELSLKDKSVYAPYVNYLLETQPPGMLPSAWSEAGQELLYRVISDKKGNQIFPPEWPFSWIEDYYDDCGGIDDPLEEYAALLVIQRSWDDLLLPVYDMMSHRNGHWLNTESNHVHEGEPVVVWASRDIKAGEEIYTTYNLCADCEARYTTYGTPEILRDYGFVENFPQTWIFHDIGVGFRVDQIEEGNNIESTVNLVEWVGEDPDDNDILKLQERLASVIQMKETVLATHDPNVAENEWTTIKQYADALEVALSVGVKTYQDGEVDSCLQSNDCSFSLDRYADLDENRITYTDDTYNIDTCDLDAQFAKFGPEGSFELLDDIQSQYQHIEFSWDPNNRDTCMSLDDIVQICDSYRPHYHEMVVHNTARFLPKIERVLFVGGGDSMLLHEILKYPTLELVVGLELDQRVTRGAFKHFGTQPHFDNEKVQWWYGDASKSLLMLPKDYFASFDMVLVDLSETVMSFQVTNELDVLDALTLLLKPSGIFVKNELYFEKFKKIFPYSAQVHWYDNPVICSQALNIGSRTLDFMKPTLTDHGVESLFIKPLHEIDDTYSLYHDYSRNETSYQLCDFVVNLSDDNGSEQVRSPGILMIVEAEFASQDLSNHQAVEEVLRNALKSEGLIFVSSTVSASENGAIIIIVLEEGYVVARTLPDRKYCGFDIHFWSRFDKHEKTKKALITSIGGSTTSATSFRIIAGGMFGVSTWIDDKKIYGPQYNEICNHLVDTNDDAKTMGDISEETIEVVIEKSLSMLGDSLKIAVLVANDMNKKSTYDGFGRVQQVVVLNCPSMLAFNEFTSDASDALTLCEKHLSDTLINAANERKLNALIIDSSADKFTASILLKIFSRKGMGLRMLVSGALCLSAVTSESDEWRKNFLKALKEDVFIDEPASYDEVLITHNGASFTLLLSNEGGEHFLRDFNSTMAELEKETKISVEIRKFEYGMWRFQDNYVPSQHFLPDDFDQTSPLKQWNTQVPLAHQVVNQLELKKTMSKDVLSEALIKEALNKTISQSSIANNLSDIEEHTSLGEGCLLAVSWPEGSIIVIWNGRNHVDLNLFTVDSFKAKATAFEQIFLSNLQHLETVLRDEQPRGLFGVVSFSSDLEEGAAPHWA